MAFFESDNLREDISLLLDVIDITRISSMSLVAKIFKWLGRQQRESIVEKFLLALNDYGIFVMFVLPSGALHMCFFL